MPPSGHDGRRRFQDAMIGSDGLPHDAFPHPRLWGTFPRCSAVTAASSACFLSKKRSIA